MIAAEAAQQQDNQDDDQNRAHYQSPVRCRYRAAAALRNPNLLKPGFHPYEPGGIDVGCYLSVAAARRASLSASLDRHGFATAITVPTQPNAIPIVVAIAITVTSAR